MNAGYGLTVRWSLEDAPADAADQLREYVVGTSIARFMFLDGLAFKVWRMREGEWFEGTYVFDSEQDRTVFPPGVAPRPPPAPGPRMLGAAPRARAGLPAGDPGVPRSDDVRVDRPSGRRVRHRRSAQRRGGQSCAVDLRDGCPRPFWNAAPR